MFSTFTLFLIICTGYDPFFFQKNIFLDRLASIEFLPISSVIMTVTLASAANIHLALSRFLRKMHQMGVDLNDEIGSAKQELNGNISSMFIAFVFSIFAILLKGSLSSDYVYGGAFLNSFVFLMFVLFILIIYDVYTSIYELVSLEEIEVFEGQSIDGTEPHPDVSDVVPFTKQIN